MKNRIMAYGYLGIIYTAAIAPIAWLFYFIHFQKVGPGELTDITANILFIPSS